MLFIFLYGYIWQFFHWELCRLCYFRCLAVYSIYVSSTIHQFFLPPLALLKVHLLASPSHYLHLQLRREIPGITFNGFQTHSPALALRWPDSVQWCARLCVFSKAKPLYTRYLMVAISSKLSLCYWIWQLHTSAPFPKRYLNVKCLSKKRKNMTN